MFEYEGMSRSPAMLADPAPADAAARPGQPELAQTALGQPAPGQAQRGERVQALQARIRQMQRRTLDERMLPTLPGLAELLPGGALRAGSAYSVAESHALVMAMLAAPSAAGLWCGVVGMPDFGVEAAAGFGIELEHLALVPHPGEKWLAVTAALADVLPVVVTRPPQRVGDADAARLAARLRQRGCTLICVGAWPQSEARLSLADASWSGLGAGHGRLTRRQVTVTVSVGSTLERPRRARLWLPSAAATLQIAPRLSAVEPLGFGAAQPSRATGRGQGREEELRTVVGA